MKIRKIVNSKYILLRLSLLKSFQSSSDYKNVDFELIELNIKRVLQIIHEYHSTNKRILFVDLPLSYSRNFKNLSKKTKHYSLSLKMLTKSLLSNDLNSYEYAVVELQNFRPLQKAKRPDLIVFCNNQPSSSVSKEIEAFKIPVLLFNPESLTSKNLVSHKDHVLNLLFFMLNSVLKRFLNN